MESLLLDKLNAIEALIQKQINKPLTFSEACQYLKVSPSYLYKLTSKGEIPHYKPSGKMIYFDKSELDSWIMREPVRPISQPCSKSPTEVCCES